MKEPVAVGLDVAAKNLTVLVDGDDAPLVLPNEAKGHQQLIRRLQRKRRRARVVLESSGVYSLDISMALHRAPNVEVMVVNPRAARDFAGAFLQRSKTDAVDAQVLCEFAKRMPFVPFKPPSEKALELRTIARRIEVLTKLRAQEKNRLHAARASQSGQTVIDNDIQVHIRHLDRRIQILEEKAVDLVWNHPQLRQDLFLMTSVKGLARSSALMILAELAVLPDDLTVRQLVAHAGLDPRAFDSGTSVHKPGRISRVGNKRLRHLLFLPALVAIQHEPAVSAYYRALLRNGKKPKQAVVAVMRKLLHAIYGMRKNQTVFDGALFYPKLAA